MLQSSEPIYMKNFMTRIFIVLHAAPICFKQTLEKLVGTTFKLSLFKQIFGLKVAVENIYVNKSYI